MFRADAGRVGQPARGSRTFDTADMAARQLFVLIKAHGWEGSEEDALAVLRDGESLVFKGFEYRVTEVAD
ncbi:hypothetical protein [Streptomyces sp. NRRL S-350]|uniref:hypothetical protein n=1 Tax=Streptomyces sp. NRRL S-350 TaxID=1463902 RepID=UPI0004BF8E50|nr:hypothetical protein [Streptomyces sp. NRRL S-350]